MVHVSPYNHELDFLLCFMLFIEYLVKNCKAKEVDIDNDVVLETRIFSSPFDLQTSSRGVLGRPIVATFVGGRSDDSTLDTSENTLIWSIVPSKDKMRCRSLDRSRSRK